MQIVAAEQLSRVSTFTLEGRLDALKAGEVRDTLQSSIANGKARIAVDLSKLDFVDSAGLAALVKAMKDARSVGGDVKLVLPVNAAARRVFELTRFDEVFDTSDNLDGFADSWTREQT